jgi:hypothetical protein
MFLVKDAPHADGAQGLKRAPLFDALFAHPMIDRVGQVHILMRVVVGHLRDGDKYRPVPEKFGQFVAVPEKGALQVSHRVCRDYYCGVAVTPSTRHDSAAAAAKSVRGKT